MAGFLAGCAVPAAPPSAIAPELSAALAQVRHQFAPDPHLTIYSIDAEPKAGRSVVLRGICIDPAACAAAVSAVSHAGFKVEDKVTVLSNKNVPGGSWAIATVSVLNVRENPGNPSEMGTQILGGHAFKIWRVETNWYQIQTDDQYVGWAEGGSFIQGDAAMLKRWQNGPLLIVVNYETQMLEKPQTNALPVADLVMGCLVKSLGTWENWDKVQLADGRTGYMPKTAGADYTQWQASRQPTAANIEYTARLFLGRPYSWGGNSPRGMDCSGMTKLVFFLNGIDLERNASEQCQQGKEIPLTDDLTHLHKGDLLFFGHRARDGRPEKVVHTGIYLGGKLFIQSSERVQISSLDPDSPLRDARRIRTLIHARRLLDQPAAPGFKTGAAGWGDVK